MIELLIERRGGKSESRIDEIAVFALRRDDRRRRRRRARREENQRDEKRSFQLCPSVMRSASSNGLPASSQCTFRSERNQVICLFANARVRRLVSAIASPSAISFATTAAASRYPIVPNGRVERGNCARSSRAASTST